MLRSMTAYGRSHIETSFGHIEIEIQSVNRKYLEIQLQLPSEFTQLEADIRQLLSSHAFRGSLKLSCKVFYRDQAPVKVIPNIPLATEIQQACKGLASALGFANWEELFFKFTHSEHSLLLFESNPIQEELYKKAILDAVEKALKGFTDMKTFEGAKLYEDIRMRLQLLKEKIEWVASHSHDAVEKQRQKLQERLKEYFSDESVEALKERIMREIALYSERVDITEEITRFQSHLHQFAAIVQSARGAIGKSLDFLLQEMVREINTISSKSAHTLIAHSIVDMKAECEKIREQLQNVE